jgi:hypothetical protein
LGAREIKLKSKGKPIAYMKAVHDVIPRFVTGRI